MSDFWIRDCQTIVTVDDADRVLPGGDILIRNGRIEAIGKVSAEQAQGLPVVSGKGLTAIPGLVQTHIHLCQSAFRNTADDKELLDWLSQYIWPGEASLGERQLKLTAQMGIAELLLGGTTTILDMATIRHTDVVFQALAESGMRAVGGKCLMDDREICPPELVEDTDAALRETLELIEKWHGHDGGRLRYAVTPRFAVSCTDQLMRESVRLAEKHNLTLHTHASENRGEIELVRKRTGRGNLKYLADVGFLTSRSCIAHCVHLEDGDMELLKGSGAHVLHCPSSNLKLASGIASIPDMLDAGVSVSLGADGAPCNNNLDAFQEMRLAALIHKPRYGPRSMPARSVFHLATRAGAHALGQADRIGQISVGYQGDVVLMDLGQPHVLPADDVFAALVYSARAGDVRDVFVGGEHLVSRGKLLRFDPYQFVDEFSAIHRSR